MDGLTEKQARQMHHFLQRLRDKLAADIVHNGLRDPREFSAVCRLLEDLKPVFYPPDQGPPPGMLDRRGNVH